jgi:hypothetical protein
MAMDDSPVETSAGPRKRAVYQDYFDAPWNAGLLRPILIALVAASAVAGPLAMLREISPWRLGYVLPVALLAALEGVYSTNRLGRPRWRDRRGLLFRVGEVVCILVVMLLAQWLFSTGLPDRDDLGLWLRHPSAVFDPQFFFVGGLILLAWALAIGITGDFLDLAIQPDEVAAHDSAVLSESRSQMRAFRPVSRSDIMARFATRWAWGGVVLVLFTALSRVEVGTAEGLQLGVADLGIAPDILAALLCYFVAGLALLSQTRLAVLRGRWYNQDIEVEPTVLRRWHVNALLAMLVVGGIAALLPIGSTGRLSAVLQVVLGFLVRIFYFVMALFTLLVTLMLYPFRFLFNAADEAPPPTTPELEVLTQEEAVSRLPDWLGGAIVWIVVGLIVAYFVVNYLRAQGVFNGRWSTLATRFRYWWRARWARLRATTDAALAGVRNRLRPIGLGAADISGLRPVRTGKLPPRERMRYFYLRMAARAADQGFERPPAATPLEYARALDQEWPNAETDVNALTEAFLAARYAEREVGSEEVREAQGVWRRVMQALRNHPAPHPPPE